MVIEPEDYQKRFEDWEAREDKQLVKDWINDKAKENISKKRLIADASRLKTIFELMKSKNMAISSLEKEPEKFREILRGIFLGMIEGKIKKANKQPYGDISDYIKRYNNFVRWIKEKNQQFPDITIRIKQKKEKPKFVYFTNEHLEQMIKIADEELRIIMLFLFDTGIRAPKELMNVMACDFENDCKQLKIREESSKTFGRTIKLMLCSSEMKKYLKDNDLEGEAPVFRINQANINNKLKKIGKQVLGNDRTIGRAKGSDLTMYDFRHSSACYWLKKYKKESSLKYRFGWTKSDMIYYYTQLLGMADDISEDDMLLDGATKSIIEKRLIMVEKKNEELSTALLKLKKDIAKIKQ